MASQDQAPPTVHPLAPHELPAAAVLLAEAMRDNPLHLRVFGVDPARREQRLQRFFGPLMRFVHANGGELHLVVQFPDSAPVELLVGDE